MDLRPILAVLNDPDADQGAVQQAVGKLATLATRGRRAAAELLEQIVTEVREGKPRFAASVRFAAANGLVSYAEPRAETGKLLVAIEGYRKLALEDWPQRAAPRSIGPRRSTLSALRCARSANARPARRALKRRLRPCTRR